MTRKSRDGGIDGIISEDKLGLDLIYIQAKRYASDNKVRLEEQPQKNVKLINGELLSELLVRYEVGVVPAQIIKLYKIDTDYFNS